MASRMASCVKATAGVPTSRALERAGEGEQVGGQDCLSDTRAIWVWGSLGRQLQTCLSSYREAVTLSVNPFSPCIRGGTQYRPASSELFVLTG